MVRLKAKIKSAKEHAGMVWFHVQHQNDIGWISVSEELFDKVFKKQIINELFSKHNREIERKIRRLNRHIRILKKEKGKEDDIRQKEYEIHSLRGKLEKELQMHHLKDKKVILKMI